MAETPEEVLGKLPQSMIDEADAVAESMGAEIENRSLSDLQANAPGFDRHYLDLLENVAWSDDTTRSLVAFNESELPQMVKTRLQEAIRGGAVFSDIESIPSSELMDFRTELADTLTKDGWSLDSLSEELSDRFGMDVDRAQTVARTETQSVVQQAREDAYEARGKADSQFKWVGTDEDGTDPNDRTTRACGWLKEQTNPDFGGDPVGLEELRDLVQEANDKFVEGHGARRYTPHINCRHTYTRHVE